MNVLFTSTKPFFTPVSVRELQKHIKDNLYGNTPKKDIQAVFQTQLPAIEPQQVFKETYDFKFIEFHSDPDEKTLQNKILDNLIKFLKELGPKVA